MFEKAIEIIMAEPTELHYPAYYADLLREADVPDMNIGKCSEIPNSSDCISRQAAIDTFSVGKEMLNRVLDETDVVGTEREKFSFGLGLIESAIKDIEKLPSAQPERTCVNCGRTANNGGWYADGGTRCPIEEHYALPKDGYCHLWEKRNVADDDYPERRTDGRD